MYAWVMIRGHSVVSYIIIITPCNEANNDVAKTLPHAGSMLLQVCKTLPHVRSMLLQVCKTSPHVRSMLLQVYKTSPHIRSMLLQVCKTSPHVRKCFCKFAKPCRTSGSASANLQNLVRRWGSDFATVSYSTLTFSLPMI